MNTATKTYRTNVQSMINLAWRYASLDDATRETAGMASVIEMFAEVAHAHNEARGLARATNVANETRVPAGMAGEWALVFDVMNVRTDETGKVVRSGAPGDLASARKATEEVQATRLEAEAAEQAALFASVHAAVSTCHASMGAPTFGSLAMASEMCGCDPADAWECGAHRRARLTRERNAR